MGGEDGEDDKYAKKKGKGGGGRVTSGRCRFCEQVDDIKHLEDPCDCYKKFEALLCHRSCLQARPSLES